MSNLFSNFSKTATARKRSALIAVSLSLLSSFPHLSKKNSPPSPLPHGVFTPLSQLLLWLWSLLSLLPLPPSAWTRLFLLEIPQSIQNIQPSPFWGGCYGVPFWGLRRVGFWEDEAMRTDGVTDGLPPVASSIKPYHFQDAAVASHPSVLTLVLGHFSSCAEKTAKNKTKAEKPSKSD